MQLNMILFIYGYDSNNFFVTAVWLMNKCRFNYHSRTLVTAIASLLNLQGGTAVSYPYQLLQLDASRENVWSAD